MVVTRCSRNLLKYCITRSVLFDFLLNELRAIYFLFFLSEVVKQKLAAFQSAHLSFSEMKAEGFDANFLLAILPLALPALSIGNHIIADTHSVYYLRAFHTSL